MLQFRLKRERERVIIRSDERDAYFQVIESTSEINCFPEWEINDNIDINELIDWLVKDDKWQEYDELKPAADIEL